MEACILGREGAMRACSLIAIFEEAIVGASRIGLEGPLLDIIGGSG